MNGINPILVFLGSLLAFASYQLAKNPEIQEMLRQEVEDVIGMSDQLKYEDVQKMNYMDQVRQHIYAKFTLCVSQKKGSKQVPCLPTSTLKARFSGKIGHQPFVR